MSRAHSQKDSTHETGDEMHTHPKSIRRRWVSDSSLFVHQDLGKPFQGQIIHVLPVWCPQNLQGTNAHESQVVLR